ncbi:MAG: undecaprenyl-diphosphate phosphatase [Candidatus Gottesmanbacteria bacterium]
MNFLQAAILGIVEGLTEYLPISSTFHLIWTAKLLRITQTDFQKTFEIIIQSGAIMAVLVLYLKTILRDFNLIKKLVVSFFPTAIIGLILYKVIKNVFFESFFVQIAIFALVGLLFIVLEKIWAKKQFFRLANQISYPEALMIGLAQALAVFPGVSRAGAVILSLMFLGVKRDEAAKYSFLLAVPTLLSASALDLVKSRSILLQQANNIPLLLVGFMASFVSALIVVRWFINYLQNNKLSSFGWYRLIVVTILIGLLISNLI